MRAIAAREVHRRYLALVHGRLERGAASASRRRSAATRNRACAWRWSRSGKPARTDVERLAASARAQRAALHAAHRPHAPDPRPPRVARPSAGRRRALRRRAGARPDAPGAACGTSCASRIRRTGAPLRLRAPSRRPTSPPRGANARSRRCRAAAGVRLQCRQPLADRRPWRSRKATSATGPEPPRPSRARARAGRRRTRCAEKGAWTAHRRVGARETLQPLRQGRTAQAIEPARTTAWPRRRCEAKHSS